MKFADALRRGLVAVGLVFMGTLVTSVQATPVTWSFTNLALGDGGTLNGSFTYESSAITSFDLITSNGAQLSGYHYLSGFDVATVSNDRSVAIVDPGFNRLFTWSCDFCNLGNASAGPMAYEVSEFDFLAGFQSRGIRDVGFVTGNGGGNVPEPSTLALISLGGLAVAGIRRRRQSAANNSSK